MPDINVKFITPYPISFTGNERSCLSFSSQFSTFANWWYERFRMIHSTDDKKRLISGIVRMMYFFCSDIMNKVSLKDQT